MNTEISNSKFLSENVIIQKISERLKSKLDIYQIIVFGSYANQNKNNDSDIDLIVILNQQGLSKSYSERIKKRLSVTQLLTSFRKTIPLDVLVYSIDEWNLLLKQDSSFINEINKTGILIS
jgi:predicted nucleotidyltransferase